MLSVRDIYEFLVKDVESANARIKHYDKSIEEAEKQLRNLKTMREATIEVRDALNDKAKWIQANLDKEARETEQGDQS